MPSDTDIRKLALAFAGPTLGLVAEAGFRTHSLSLQEQEADHEAGYASQSPAGDTSTQSEPADAADAARQGPTTCQLSMQSHKGVLKMQAQQALHIPERYRIAGLI